MRSRLWPGLLLGALLPGATLPAQTIPQPEGRLSHRPIPGSLEQNMRPEDAVDGRLSQSRARKGRLDQLGDARMQAEIQKLAMQLLKDEKFMKSLQGKLTRENAENLLGKVGAGGGIGDDPAMHQLLKQALQSAG